MKRSSYPKNNVEVAQTFFEDTCDLVLRFDVTFQRFHPIKTRRFKCFIDLRLAYECILKAILAYQQPKDMEREALIRTVEKRGHNISALEAAVSSEATNFGLESWGSELDHLPIGLRYSLDGQDFRDMKEDLYYKTVGSDVWLHHLRDYLVRVRDVVNEELKQYNGIVTIADIPTEKLLGGEYNKYRK
jgi:hypothetical protein